MSLMGIIYFIRTVNKKTLSELIYKKGHCSSDNKR